MAATRPYLTQSFGKVSSQKSTPPHIRQRILYMRNSKGYVEGIVEDLTSAKRLETLCVR